MLDPTKVAELHTKAKCLLAELNKLIDSKRQNKFTPELWAMLTHLKYTAHGAQKTVSELEYAQRYADNLVYT